MSAEYPGALWAPIPGFGFPRGAHGGNHPKWIVLHGTASPGATAQNIANYFAGDNQNGTHFVIGKDGMVIQMVQLHDAAYGNGGPTGAELAQHKYADFWDAEIAAGVNLNTVTISIEHCKFAIDNSDILTQAQQEASFKLVAWLCKTLGIPPRQADAAGGITGHFSINGIERVNCPGPYPWDALWQYLAPVPPVGGRMIIKHPIDPARYDLAYVSGGTLKRRTGTNPGEFANPPAGVQDWGAPAGATLDPHSVSCVWTSDGNNMGVLVAAVSGELFYKSMNNDGSVGTDWTAIATEDVTAGQRSDNADQVLAQIAALSAPFAAK